MNPIADILKTEIEARIENTNFHLIDLKFFRSKRNIQISVFIDREDGYFSHKDCAYWNKQIQDIIDGKDLIADYYRLDVSSPGIGRSLQQAWEFRKNIERELQIDFTDEEGVVRTISGILTDVSEENIILKIDEDVKEFARESISKAVIKMPW